MSLSLWRQYSTEKRIYIKFFVSSQTLQSPNNTNACALWLVKSVIARQWTTTARVCIHTRSHQSRYFSVYFWYWTRNICMNMLNVSVACLPCSSIFGSREAVEQKRHYECQPIFLLLCISHSLYLSGLFHVCPNAIIFESMCVCVVFETLNATVLYIYIYNAVNVHLWIWKDMPNFISKSTRLLSTIK